MSREVRVLIVEDNASDAKLVERELRRGGLTVDMTRVESAEGMRDALRRTPWDIVLSDWGMPGFNALGALQLLKECGSTAPFIIVSGTIGEEAAVKAMREGASDYVPKGRLTPRLSAVVERELRKSEERLTLKATRKALHQSETRMARLRESGIVGIAVLDLGSGLVVEHNQAFLSMLGYTSTPPHPITWASLRNAESGEGPADPEFEELRSLGVIPLREEHWTRIDGKPLPVMVGLAMLEDDHAIACVADMSEQHRIKAALDHAEQQLQRAQRMEAVGNLAGGVAHDFNNLLTVVLGEAELMEDQIASDGPLARGLANIQHAAARASELTRQLLAFGRRQVFRPRVITLGEVVAGVEPMLTRLLGEDIEIAVHKSAEAARIVADPGQLEHVVINLAINARDAMPRGGRLTMTEEVVEVGGELATTYPELNPGPYASLVVSDTGFGMDEDTQARIFEPFFTTKGTTHGTGLGLAMVFGIVRQSEGHILVQSEPGQGTTFRLYFPVVSEEDLPAFAAPSAAPGKPQGGSETILLVEDEAQVRELLEAVLSGAGYRVLAAPDGRAALEIAAAHPGTIDLLCSDLVMPRMSGRELAANLSPTRPSMKVLFVSGYPGTSVAQREGTPDATAILDKPVLPGKLLRHVRRLLDTPQAN